MSKNDVAIRYRKTNVLDNNFRRPLSPISLIVISWTIWFIVKIFSGFNYKYEISEAAWVFVAISTVSFILGSSLNIVSKKNKEARKLPYKQQDEAFVVNQILNVILPISIAAFGLSLLFPSGTGLFASSEVTQMVRESRNQISDSFSIAELSTPLSAAGLVSAVIIGYFPLRILGLSGYVKASLSFSLMIIQWSAVGGRTVFAYAGLALLFAYFSRPDRKQISLKIFLLITSAILGFVLITNWVLEGRLTFQRKNYIEATTYLTNAHALDLPNWVSAKLLEGNESFVYSMISLTHYVVHGVYEFGYLFTWRNDNNAPLGFGQISFSPIPEKVSNALGVALPSYTDFSPRSGVYQGLYGTFLVDFGPIGMIFAFGILGIIAGTLYRKSKTRTNLFPTILMYSPISVIVFSTPFFNALSGAGGIYMLFFCGITAWFYNYLSCKHIS